MPKLTLQCPKYRCHKARKLACGLFISAYCAYPVALGPEMQPVHPTLVQQLTANPNRTLALNKRDDERHRIFRRSFQAQVDVVGHCMPFEYLHVFLLTKLAKNSSDGTSELAVDNLPLILRNE